MNNEKTCLILQFLREAGGGLAFASGTMLIHSEDRDDGLRLNDIVIELEKIANRFRARHDVKDENA